MSMDLERRLLERIEEEGIRPYPRWVGWLRRGGSATLVALALLGSTLAAAIFFLWLFQGADRGPHRGFRWVMIGILPWLSLASALVSSWLAWRVFRRTGTGYRRRAWVVVGTFFLCSVVGGFALQTTGGLFLLHRELAMNWDAYRDFFQGRRSVEWSKPQEGRLAGAVVALDSTGLSLADPNGRTWRVLGRVPGWVEVGMEIRLEGRAGSERLFHAERIDRFGPGGSGMGHGMHRQKTDNMGCEP